MRTACTAPRTAARSTGLPGDPRARGRSLRDCGCSPRARRSSSSTPRICDRQPGARRAHGRQEPCVRSRPPGERAIGVLAIGTLSGHHAFEQDELTLAQALAAEAALALERSRTEDALSDALDRERLIASIAQQVRSEMRLDAVLDVATRETSIALDLIRCFIRLGEPGGPMPMAFEWPRRDSRRSATRRIVCR